MHGPTNHVLDGMQIFDQKRHFSGAIGIIWEHCQPAFQVAGCWRWDFPDD